MAVVKILYELQQLDLKIQREMDVSEEIAGRLGESEELVQAKATLMSEEESLDAATKRQRDLEQQIEGLSEKIAHESEKLYGGKVKNPKELVGIEQEIVILGTKLRQQEDALLDIMAEVEATQKRAKVNAEKLHIIEEKWQMEQRHLSQQKADTEKRIADLGQKRKELAAGISHDSLELYEATRLKRGQAVVRIEQGRCQGCRLMLSTSELQRARTGNIVLCNTCNRILYLG